MKEKNTNTKKKNLAGRKSTLTDELASLIIDVVRKNLSIAYAAEFAEQPRSTVMSWISRGTKDFEDGIESEYARFATGIKKARAEFVLEALGTLKMGYKNWQSTAWVLERCCAEDFGKDSELYKQLLEDYKMLMQALVDQNKGVNHGCKT